MFGDMTENMGVKWREEGGGWQLMDDTSQIFEYVQGTRSAYLNFETNLHHVLYIQCKLFVRLNILIFLTDVLVSRYVAQTYEDNGGYNGGVVDHGGYQVYIWGVGLHEV